MSGTPWSWLRMWYMGFPEAAIEHAHVASELIQIFDQAEGRVFLLKPTGINTEGMERYEI